MTQAQLRFLGKVIRTGGHSDCADIGEFRARQACYKRGYLENDKVTAQGFWLVRITDKARAEMHKMAMKNWRDEFAA